MSIQLAVRAAFWAFRVYGAYKFVIGEGPVHDADTTRLARVGRGRGGAPFQLKFSRGNVRGKKRGTKKSRKRQT